jgi:hypothetical protein
MGNPDIEARNPKRPDSDLGFRISDLRFRAGMYWLLLNEPRRMTHNALNMRHDAPDTGVEG